MTSGGFFEQFIDDYFAECDEHLASMRRVLLALEGRIGTALADGGGLPDLLRSLHTVKGLSGMVGLGSAERIAHAMENVVRGQQSAGVPVSRQLVETLFDATQQLERCIVARRTGAPAPELDAFLAKLETVGLSSAAVSPGRGSEYRFQFVPSEALAARGIGVASTRARLESIGDVLEAKPHIADGGVVFEFRVASRADAAPEERWRTDGLSWTVGPASLSSATGTPQANDDGAVRQRHSGAAPDSLAAAVSGSNVVRVDLARLDEVMQLVGQLVASRGRLVEAVGHADGSGMRAAREMLQETSAAMDRQLRDLRKAVTRIRLVPLGEVFERLRFAVRELARDAGKEVVLDLGGQDTEIDKVVVDRMVEPLLHLVRNAMSHGIEAPDERVARGKPAKGRLALRASAAGDRIRIEVEDDGAGIDAEQVAARARAAGVTPPDGAQAHDDLLGLLCTPGFSTRDAADLTSGRGVGMDVVRSTVRELGGELSLETTAGRGTRFTIDLPITLMIVDALLVEIDGQRMAVPQPALREVLRLDATMLTRFENNEVMAYRGGVLPLVSLRRLFGLAGEWRGVPHLLVVGSDAQPVGLVVDRLLGLREVVVHPVPDPLLAVPGIAGATELSDGRVSLILDTAALVRLARERRQPVAWRAPLEGASESLIA